MDMVIWKLSRECLAVDNMILFNKQQCMNICLKNDNPYVRLAVEDMQKDFARRGKYGVVPQIIGKEDGRCIVIEENNTEECAPILNEGFVIKSDGNNIRIIADGYLGTMWGIYTFCEKYLGIDPCYIFNDMEIQKLESLEVDSIYIEDKPQGFGFRGVFINDEDLLTGWMDGGGIRGMDYPWYTVTVDEKAMDMVVETVLRLKLNLVIPASFLNIDNPPEKLLVDCVAKRGIYLSQHHLEPLGLSHFTLEEYCRKFNKHGEYSYIKNPDFLEEAWKFYAEKWAEYDNVVWQIGLRGKADRPVWEEAEVPTEEEFVKYGAFISNALERQKQIVMEATGGKAKYFTSTLWMEGSRLIEKGVLKAPEGTVLVFADTGPNQMYGADYYQVPRSDDVETGIYYHLQYFCCGPHLAPQTGLDKLYYNLKLARDMGDDSYCIINASNIREFVFELTAYANMLWDIDGFTAQGYLNGYAKAFGEQGDHLVALIQEYYKSLPEIDVRYLAQHHEKYFNYDFNKAPEGIENFVLKEGNVLEHGRTILDAFHRVVSIPLGQEFYQELLPTIPKYVSLCERLQALADVLPEHLKKHIEVKWLCYAMTLRYIYEWYVHIYEAKEYRHALNSEQMKESLRAACQSLENYLEYRKCAEYGIFEHWYRGDLKMDIKQKLYDTKRLLGQTPDFQ